MRIVVSVMGKDRTGIIARVSGLLYKENINILDITQTILQDLFTMVMLADTSGSALSFDDLLIELNKLAQELRVEIRAQRADLFDAMNKV
ncbi:MAG: ACT domain-containing protein [Treponema sp.]|nr:ACT domain-containing protein [Treponema sp.]